jgi:TRAP-type C4-dicarboxylate transport system permease small subunit
VKSERGWLAGLHRIEEWALTVLVIVLVVLSGAQIVMRNVFGGGFAWADPFLRTLVVWAAMLGALAAVREDKHIAVDVLQRFLPRGAQHIARVLTLLFAAGICTAMAWYSVGFVGIDFGSPSSANAEGVPWLPAWVLETILPFGFGMMALRFALRAFATPSHVPGIATDALLHAPAEADRDEVQP